MLVLLAILAATVVVEASKRFEKGLVLGFILAQQAKYGPDYDPYWPLYKFGYDVKDLW